jgi:L-asparaginase
MKKILMITTGGTIACIKTSSGLIPHATPEELLKEVEIVNSFCKPTGINLMCLDSTDMLPSDWLKIKECIQKNYNDYDGFVICHGTDTLSFTASALSYLIQNSKKPIVLTGAQKPISTDSTDARNNLIDSFRYASHEHAKGVVVVFDGKVISGTKAQKIRSKSFNAFNSINFPEIAKIVDGNIFQYIYQDIVEDVKFYDSLNEKVSIVTLTPGMNKNIIDAYFKENDAVIVSSYGTGGIPNRENYSILDRIQYWLAQGKILVMATQVQQEGSDMSIYHVALRTKEKVSFLEAFDMSLPSVLTKMMWILSITNDQEVINDLFYKTINFDILYKGKE